MSRLLIVFSSLFLAIFLVAIPILFPRAVTPVSSLENIHGIPFPHNNSNLLITEPLAHTDIKLNQSTFGRDLHLIVTFNPGNLQSLMVGIRENSFWLSYPQIPIWEANPGVASPDTVTSAITIPLTDKLAASDQSVDLMFFATPAISTDNTLWTLQDISLTTTYSWPTLDAFKDIIKSILYRERLL